MTYPNHNVEAKKKKYTVQVLFVEACSCTFPVTIKIKDDDGSTIAKRSVDIGHLADIQDDSDVYGPKISVTDKKDQHPNEITVCMSNSHTKNCQAIRYDSGSKYTVEFNARDAGRDL